MPASLRARQKSSRPYERRSPTASPAQLEPLVCSPLSRGLPLSPSIQDPKPEVEPKVELEPGPETETEPEDIPPDRPGLPTYAEYKRIETGYLHSLSPRKRDKALITQVMFDKIWDVLHQPDACTVETPQFRFWVRKMFTLSRPMVIGGWWERPGSGTHADSDSDTDDDLELERAMGIHADPSTNLSAVVLHENRPVAIREQLYELFCYCHVRAGHGGRDKTCAVIRQHYSWVPKELTAQFVKVCPTCASKRGGQGLGLDLGVVPRRVGQRERRAKGTRVKAEETPVGPSSLGSGWPTTGGPLDPANPKPCDVRKRAERAWLREREQARTSSPVSPASNTSDSRTRSVPRETPSRWGSVPRATLAVPEDASPFADENRSTRRVAAKDERSPTRTAGLPSLATALSNESLDENVNLSGLGPGTLGPAGDPLPPLLRPLRLSGPMTHPDAEPHPVATASSSLFQIDPVLLHFSYPGLGMSEFESPFCLRASDVEVERVRTAMDTSVLECERFSAAVHAWDVEDAVVSHTTGLQSPLLLSTEPRCTFRYDPLGMIYSCSADQVGHDLDSSFSFSIMTDA